MNKAPHTIMVILLAIIFNTSITFAYENPSTEQEVTQTTALTLSSANECQVQIQQELNKQRSRRVFKRAVNTGDTITMQYIVRLSDGSLVDTSNELIAKSCGLYNDKRDYNAGISFKAGDGALIKGVDQGIIGMRLNSSKNIKVSASEAYGEASITNNHPLAGKDLIFDIAIRRIKR